MYIFKEFMKELFFKIFIYKKERHRNSDNIYVHIYNFAAIAFNFIFP